MHLVFSASYGGRDYSNRKEEETKDLNQPDVGSASPRYSKKDDKDGNSDNIVSESHELSFCVTCAEEKS